MNYLDYLLAFGVVGFVLVAIGSFRKKPKTPPPPFIVESDKWKP